MADSSTQPKLSAANMPVRRRTEAQGSPLAWRAAMLESRYTSTVGTVTAVPTPGRSWVVASIGMRKKPLRSMSAVQLSWSERLANTVRAANASTSTNRANQTNWTGRSPPCCDHLVTAPTQMA